MSSPGASRCSSVTAALVVLLACAHPSFSETGRDLWLRYPPVEDRALRDAYRAAATSVVAPSESPTGRLIASELRRGLRGLLGADVPASSRVSEDGVVLAGTPSASREIAALGWQASLARLGNDGYVIRSTTVGGRRVIAIASQAEVGVLYGVFHFLRLLQTGRPIAALDVAERPRLQLRLLDHWDNLDGTIERGYAGRSLWSWKDLPERVDPRLAEYARANASIGINGSVLNNVNANADVLTRPYLAKVAAIARVFRPYGIRVYLSANFNAPRSIGGLATADPLDPGVARWWREKADEIYSVIPDFGGFLVKANSEGQPGPQDYKRTHADGANVLADALGPHGGIVMWRAFVYADSVDADRVKRAYLEFVPLDGRFRDNVLVQVKNGPLDFQPREPFSPLFGAMAKTPLMAELQITQEYLGQSNHLVYLGPMWTEFLSADTYAAGPGTTVSKVLEASSVERHASSVPSGTVQRTTHDAQRAPHDAQRTTHDAQRTTHDAQRTTPLTGMAGVANTGTDENWTGHHFAQANWYAFGRLAWNPEFDAGAIADEWIRMTWSREPRVVDAIKTLMLGSRETYVDYTMPLGLHHLIGGDHYAPMPENDDPRRLDWSAVYYHRADAKGIGFDRTRKGSDAVDQYHPPLNDRFNDLASCPEPLLLWFHRLPWDHRMSSGRTLWDELVARYAEGAAGARAMETAWKALDGQVDAERYAAVLQKLQRQASDAAAWSTHIVEYFQKRKSGM